MPGDVRTGITDTRFKPVAIAVSFAQNLITCSGFIISANKEVGNAKPAFYFLGPFSTLPARFYRVIKENFSNF
jgi:hypothetical protein